MKKEHILVRILKRSFAYILKGYAIAAIPLSFIGAASSAYYLFIENVPFLKSLFPNFSDFILTLGIPMIIGAGLIGYAYFKKTWLFRTEVEVTQESNSQIVITSYLGMQATLQMLEKLDIEPTEDFKKRMAYWKGLYDKIEW